MGSTSELLPLQNEKVAQCSVLCILDMKVRERERDKERQRERELNV